ncbi:MAG: CIA30 family protein [Bacteroidota bacterium]
MTFTYLFLIWIIPLIMGGYKEEILLDFSDRDEIPEWLIINDEVMGGVSSSDLEFIPAGYLKFTGNVSLENNGGFASFRTQTRTFDLTDYEGIKIRIRGDGKKYSFRLKTGNSYNDIAYAADFKSMKESWQEIEIPFNDFTPRYRGRIILDAEEIDRSVIKQLGFLIADNQEGSFALEIDWIKAYSY